MTVQSTVYFTPGLGVPGEVILKSPHRAQPFTINSSGVANIFGNAFSYSNTAVGNVASAGNVGGALLFAGYLVNPKEHALYGVLGNTLGPTLTLPDNSIAALLDMGIIVTRIAATREGGGAVQIGDKVIFANATGLLSTIAPATALPVGFSYGYATVTQLVPSTFSALTMLAVIKVTNIQNLP